MPKKKYPVYPFYILQAGKIVGGYEFKEDAQEALREHRNEGATGLKVCTKAFVLNEGIDLQDDWADVDFSEDGESNVKKKKAKFGLTVKPRVYRCKTCGHVQHINTNHTDDVSEYCQGCSWKGESYGGHGHKIPALGPQTYRRFEYVGEVKRWGPGTFDNSFFI